MRASWHVIIGVCMRARVRAVGRASFDRYKLTRVECCVCLCVCVCTAGRWPCNKS